MAGGKERERRERGDRRGSRIKSKLQGSKIEGVRGKALEGRG